MIVFFRSLNDPHEERCVTQGLGMARHELVTLVVKDTVLKLNEFMALHNKCL